MTQENVNIIRGLYESFARGDVPGVLGLFAPDVEWVAAENSPYGAKSPYIGPNAVLENVFMRIGADWEDFSVTVNELINAGEKVVMLGYYNGRYKPTGKQVRAQVAHVWTLEGGKVAKFQQYTDTKQFAEAMKSESGVSPAA